MTPKLAAAVGLVLVAALVVPATAATPKAGSWSGETKQNKSISFKVTPGGEKVKKLKFGFKAGCENGSRINGTTESDGKFPITDGKFKAELGNSVVKGEFTGKKKAEGTLKANASTLDPFTNRIVNCHSGKVGWTAKH
jgi:hypothetical protein